MTKTLHELRNWASDKENFQKIEDFSAFDEEYLLFSQDGLQARIELKKKIIIFFTNTRMTVIIILLVHSIAI